ncbi:phosphonate transport system substrate-binding protein [Epibacterium ulvae]|uniref:Phosphonate transport system substrate-binding protein n=1 Tax=Epibacterium ulvae TaxID=1156985 RepID=A0A1G5PJ38_9RHOB|nr:PhnD/SsuA/transferrin family substrate-binding protein [Epibacterium ulvae]SCZ49448.1 phosphonate transport system substrate-binding protein [Epibacterium ulvae]
MERLITYKLPKFGFPRLLAIIGCWAYLALPSQADISLTFGTYAADKPTETVRKYRPFLSFLEIELSKALGEAVSIKMVIAKEYEHSIDQLANGEVDFSRFGPASYVLATKKNPDVEIIAMESQKGQKRFKGVIAVHEESEINDLSELAGHSFAFGDELSTIGRYLSQALLLSAGISGADLQTYEFLGRHDRVGTAVGSERFTAGALKESTFKKLVKSGVPIRELTTFDNVTKPWLASSTLAPHVVEAMRHIMLEEANASAVKQIAKHGFLEGDDADYQLVRDAMEDSQSF